MAEHNITGKIGLTGTISGRISVAQSVSGGLSITRIEPPEYTGSYYFAPSNEIQTISIANQKATDDITIDAIPNNYGLITWNGAYLTVS